MRLDSFCYPTTAFAIPLDYLLQTITVLFQDIYNIYCTVDELLFTIAQLSLS